MKLYNFIRYLILLILLLCVYITVAQKPIISGLVTDEKNGEPLAGVNLIYGDNQGVATDAKGFYRIVTEPGRIRLQFRFVGYHTLVKNINVQKGDFITLDVQLLEETQLLSELVVSASRYEQKLSDVIVSMEVINKATIENTHSLSIESALQQVQGVMLLDDQISIRGGNGYSYGVGSRVMLLLDDLPILTGGGGEAKWDFVPIENLHQVEVIKGASSAIYGSSALNGVVNIRTSWPGTKPETNLTFYSGIYGQPKRKEIAWWGNTQPFYSGLRFMHSRQAGNLDIVIGGNMFSDIGYRENEHEQYARFNMNTRYRNQKIKGLSYGVNTNYMMNKGGNFLLWLDGDTGVYRSSPVFDQKFDNKRFNFDPHITYFSGQSRHTLRGRIFNVAYDNDSLTNHDDTYFAEYQYLHQFKRNLTLTAGVNANKVVSESNLFSGEKNTASTQAIYFQAEKQYRDLKFTLGGRYEFQKVNKDTELSGPLLRAGINYQAAKFTFLRASFGQGFRYPAIAEKYAFTMVGALRIFPNMNLKPEHGWNSEIGIKQGYSFGKIRGYMDAVVFWTEYRDMIEFTFGQHYPDTLTNPDLFDFFNYTGFKAENISDVRINGFEIGFVGEGKAGALNYQYNFGYTYINPVDKNFDKESALKYSSTDKNILKYRFYHSSKAAFDVSYRKISSGFNIDYHSYMINIDKAFEDSLRFENGVPYGIILPGMKAYREKHNKGDVIVNWRFSWEPVPAIRMSAIINNLFNREYMTRPADVRPPRVFALQLSIKL